MTEKEYFIYSNKNKIRVGRNFEKLFNKNGSVRKQGKTISCRESKRYWRRPADELSVAFSARVHVKDQRMKWP